MAKNKKKPVFRIINNNNDEQMNIMVKKIVDNFLKKEEFNIKYKKTT